MAVNRRNTVLATLLGNSANTFLISIQAIVLIPLYLNTVGPRLYGAWLGSGDVLLWLQTMDFGLALMMQRVGVAHARKDIQSVGEYFASGTFILAIVALTMAAVGVALSFFLPGWMSLQGLEAETLKGCFQIGAVAAAMNMINKSAIGLAKAIQKTMFINGVLITSTLIGFATSLFLVLTGWGLWSVALGLVARSVVGFIGGFIFIVATLRGGIAPFFRLRLPMLKEYALVSPASALGGLSYALMNQSESALVAILIKPELAVVLTLTRKASEIVRILVDLIGSSSFGSFAHLVGSDQRHRTLQVYAEINSLRLSIAIALASAYMAVNEGLVSLWVGSAHYGGAFLTILIALRLIVVGSAYLMNLLYRATGPIMRGSVLLIIESIIRVSLMILLLQGWGLLGIPMASIVTAIPFGILIYRWTLQEIAVFAEPHSATPNIVWFMRVLIFGIGSLLALTVHINNWFYVLGMGAAIAGFGSLALIYVDPLLLRTRSQIMVVLERLQIVPFRTNVKSKFG